MVELGSPIPCLASQRMPGSRVKILLMAMIQRQLPWSLTGSWTRLCPEIDEVLRDDGGCAF
ncbi:unnamed protein product [Symbiodinium pilosum]|uniref:Uncharacterized protein n=1 Tax=Symbiodinium pilosum TaxID=2952 RepID=A0A812QY64_SYMPI|nr:unnamed protein product [Symbiodinium pilosum]